MKSLFSRFSDTQAGSSKPTKESSYKFWIPSNTNAERSPPKSIPVHPDVAASHGEKRYRALNSAHALKVPLLDISTAPLETQAIRTNDMARHTTRQNIGSSSMPYSQNYPPISSRTPRPHEHGDTKYQVYSREAQGPAYPSGTHSRETSGKSHRGGRRESWLPSTTPAVSKQVEDEAKLHVQGRSEKIERYRESGDERDRGKELERREKDRDRDRKEKEREWEKGRIREREREERDRERSRAKERERILEKEREIARAKREQDRNLEIGRERDRDKYTERDHRERERDSDREGEKGKNRTKDKGSRKESSNLTRGTERALNSDVPYDGERTKQEERNKVHHRGRATGGGRKDDSYESQKERDRWLEKEPERARERLGGQIKHRAEATDGEQDAGRVRTPAPDRERRRDPGIGWASDTHTGHSRKLLRKTSNTLINPSPGVEDGESSDSSTRPKYMHQLLTKRHRAEEGGGSSSKIIHRQGMSAEPFGSTKPSAVKATIVSFSEDVQLPVPPTPQHMPIYLPPKESYIIDAGLPPTIVPLNVVSAREAEALSRREILNRLKSSRPDEPPPHAGDVSRPREIDTPIVRRPPSRGPAQPQNLFPSHATIAHSSKGTRESGYIHRPRHTQPSLMTVHDKLQTPGSSPLPEIPYTSTQADGSKEPNRSLERLPDSRLKKEVEVDIVPSVLHKVQHRIPPQNVGAVPSRQPMGSTSQTVIPSVTHPPPQQGSNLQSAVETDPSHNLHKWGPAVMSGNNLVHETHSVDPPSNTVKQSLQSAPLNENIIQDSGKPAVDTVIVSKMNEVEAVTQPRDEVSLSSVKPTERLDQQLYTGLSIHRPSTAMDYRSNSGRGSTVRPYMTSLAFSMSQDTDTSKMPSGWRNNVNVISPNTLPNQEKCHAATSNVDVHPKMPPLKSSQLRSNGQESLDIVIARPSTTTGFRQNTSASGKNLRHYNNMPPDTKAFHGEGFQAATISLGHSDAQNSIGISIPRPSTATAIKQNSSGHSSRQTFNTTSHKLNPLVEEEHSNIFPGPSNPRHNSIPATNLQPTTLPVTEKGSEFPTQPYTMTPSNSAGQSLTRGHAIALPEDVTVHGQDVPGSHRQGHTEGMADLNIISHPDNSTSQASTTLNPKPDNLRNLTIPLAVSIPTLNDDLVKLHSASMSAYRQGNRGASDHVPSIAQNSQQAFKENSDIPQPAALASANSGSAGNNITLNAKASDAQPIILPLGFTVPQIQIRPPPHSLSTRNNSVPSAVHSAVIVPQIQIHHLITATSTGNKPESPHSDVRAGASTPRTPGAGADLETPDINRLVTVNVNVVPIHVDQPQTPLGSGNKYHKPIHLVPASTFHTANANNVRPYINEGTLPSRAEDPRLRLGSSQEVSTQTFVHDQSLASSYQPDPASSANQTRHDSVQNPILNMQMNNDLAQDPPSLGFFNNAFSEVLHSPVVRRSGQGDYLAMKADGKKIHDLCPASAVFESDKDDGTDQVINMKISEPLVDGDAAKNALLKDHTEVPLVERLTTRKNLHIDIHNSKSACSRISSEVNPSPKGPSSQPRIQHPGLAEILSPPPLNKDHNADNGQSPSSSATYHQPTTSSTVPKSESSPKFQGSADKQRPDDKLVSPKSSPSRQSPSDLRQKEAEQYPHESPKDQQQTPTPISRSAHLQHLLSDPHGNDSLSLAPSRVPSSSSHPSIVLQPYTTITSSVPDGLTRPSLESMRHVYNKKSGQPSTSHPEVPISTSRPSQVEELTSRKIRPPSIVDFKPSSNSIPHYRIATPLRESTSTSTRHQHSSSLPVDLVPSANVPSADGPLRSATHPPLHHHSTSHSQTKPGYTRPPGSQTLAPKNITHTTSDSEETILMTPSSLAHSVMLKPTISRESVTPSISSQTARKNTGIFTRFRSKTPAQPPQYEIWHPNTSSGPNVASSSTMPSSITLPEQKAPAPIPVAVPIAIERISQKSKVFTPFRYLTTKRKRTVSLVSVEAQDGTAPSTVVGSPTASMHSQAPFQPPPVRDAMQATKEWRNKEEAEAHPNGKLRRQRPGVVFDVAEEPPGVDRQRPKRTHPRHKSSSKLS